MSTTQFWFSDFQPDALVKIQNPKQGKNFGITLKKAIMESALAIEKATVFYDPVLSKILNAELYYISMGKKKSIIGHLNKDCQLTPKLNPYVLNIQIEEGDKIYILIESRLCFGNNLEAHCLQTQLFYNLRRDFLNGVNRFRTPSEFTRMFFYPIADALTDFLVQNGMNCNQDKRTKYSIKSS